MSKHPLAHASNHVGLTLFTELFRQHQNVLISPTSIALLLALVGSGARGATQRAILRILDMKLAHTTDQTSATFLQTLTPRDPQTRLKIATALWAAPQIHLQPAFIHHSQIGYDAHIATLAFGDRDAIQTINRWVREHTDDMITTIVERLHPATRVVLLNAISFKGAWEHAFDSTSTQTQTFTRGDGTHKQHAMMAQSGTFSYATTADTQVLRLPFRGGRLSMLFLLPTNPLMFAAFCQTLTQRRWTTLIHALRPQTGNIVIPRFRITYDILLHPILARLGLAITCDAQADFSGIAGPETPLMIDEIHHKTVIEVTEEGAEAAAVTAMMMQRSGPASSRSFRMVLDRPFCCAIVDEATSALLFIGAIVDPKDIA